jgi:hypothetical protein
MLGRSCPLTGFRLAPASCGLVLARGSTSEGHGPVGPKAQAGRARRARPTHGRVAPTPQSTQNSSPAMRYAVPEPLADGAFRDPAKRATRESSAACARVSLYSLKPSMVGHRYDQLILETYGGRSCSRSGYEGRGEKDPSRPQRRHAPRPRSTHRLRSRTTKPKPTAKGPLMRLIASESVALSRTHVTDAPGVACLSGLREGWARAVRLS